MVFRGGLVIYGLKHHMFSLLFTFYERSRSSATIEKLVSLGKEVCLTYSG